MQGKSNEYQTIRKETEQKLNELETFKEEEYKKLKYYFAELHRCLDSREDQIKR